MNSIKTRIIKIGNSRGIRIPKVLIDQAGLSDEIEIAVQHDRLVLRPSSRPRQDWSEQFRAMAEYGDDLLMDVPLSTTWDTTEWKW